MGKQSRNERILRRALGPRLVVENRHPLWYETASPAFKESYGEPPPLERKRNGAWARYFDKRALETPPLPPEGKLFPDIVYPAPQLRLKNDPDAPDGKVIEEIARSRR